MDGYTLEIFNNKPTIEKELLDKVSNVIKKLKKQPFIAPTGFKSLQLEYDHENGEDYIYCDCYTEYIELDYSINKKSFIGRYKYTEIVEVLDKLVEEMHTDKGSVN